MRRRLTIEYDPNAMYNSARHGAFVHRHSAVRKARR
jgi:hypothetical protein